jgi:hypothetical protein
VQALPSVHQAIHRPAAVAEPTPPHPIPPPPVVVLGDELELVGAGGERRDAALLRLIISEGLFASIQNFSTFSCGIIIAFVGGWQLTLVMFGIMPLTAASYSIATKRLTGLAGDTRKLFERAMQIATDAVSNVRTVAAFGAEQRVLRLFELQLDGPLVAARHAAFVGGCSQAFSQIMATLPPAFSFYIGGLFIEKKIMRCGRCSAFACVHLLTCLCAQLRGRYASFFRVAHVRGGREPGVGADRRREHRAPGGAGAV